MVLSTRLMLACALVVASASMGACSSDSSASDTTGGGKDGGGGGGGGFGNGGGPDGSGGGGLPCNPSSTFAEIPGNNCDDDGDGKVDNVPVCDNGLSATGDATAFAHAIGICDDASSKGFGLVSAAFTRGYKSTDAPMMEQHSILPKFGDVIKPHEGSMLGVISSGYAQEFDGPGGVGTFNSGKDWFNYGTGNSGKPGTGIAPPTFPKKATGCPQNATVNDTVNVKLTLKVPPNANGFKFDLDFWSGEWPGFVCSPFNDAFIAYVTSQNTTDNISVDPKGNPISVNAGFANRCQTTGSGVGSVGCNTASGAVKGTAACDATTVDELKGTGFFNQGMWCNTDTATGGASTGWLTSSATVVPGETFTIEFMIWDAGDGVLDSTTLLDNFRWTPDPIGTGTGRGPK